jgi:Sulfotransferase family
MPLPDFFVIGAPKAGTTALHAALAGHPQLHLSSVKEPKYFLGDDHPSRRVAGPGDAHSAREWVWQRDRYEALFADAPAGTLRGESTPFYLYDLDAHRRIARAVPDAKLVAVLRDPVDRAYSNWMHLWSDGLERVADFATACRLEDERIAAGWGHFWHYRRTGLYGDQLAHLFTCFPREQVHLLRYRDLVDQPRETLDGICTFLGVATGHAPDVPRENSRPFVRPGLKTRTVAPIVRLGAAVGSRFPPQAWRRASTPLLRLLQSQDAPRPRLAVDTRRELVDFFADDIWRLGRLTGNDYTDWLGDQGAGEYSVRRSWAPSERVAS